MRKYLLGFLFILPTYLHAQDTLHVNIEKLDSLFLANNLLLLAEKYQIDIAKSAEIQTKLWNNPNLSVDFSTYNKSRGLLDVGKNGQKAIVLQQLITTAGKRNKQLAIDMEFTRQTENQFFDLMRTLKFALREVFFESYFLSKTIALYDLQIQTLQKTLSAFETEYSRNNISLMEVVRLKALLFQLTNDRAAIQFEINDNQKNLRIMLQTERPVVPIVSQADIAKYQLRTQTLETLKTKALQSRSDLKIAQSVVKQAELNYSLQKSLAVPNVQIGASYDQSSNYVNHYWGLTASIDLPFFNRNQGNIRAAKSGISYSKANENHIQNTIINEVDALFQKVLVADKAFNSVENQFTKELQKLNQGIYANFQKRNITLLEFIDFIETYNESNKAFNRLQADRIKVYEELNFVVGEELFN
jgi:cobalt-zinc-cadmium efflux system outer membrane protein